MYQGILSSREIAWNLYKAKSISRRDTMKKYVVCGDCGRKLCKAEPGSVVELVCPKCKKPVVAMVKEDGIVMLDQSIKKAT